MRSYVAGSASDIARKRAAPISAIAPLAVTDSLGPIRRLVAAAADNAGANRYPWPSRQPSASSASRCVGLFDALGDDIEVERLRHGEDREHDAAVGALGRRRRR